MKRYAAVFVVVAFALATAPGRAQFLKKLEQGLLGSQGQPQAQATAVGNVNLPPGQYVMTNVQTGQAYQVTIQNGQMFLTGSQTTQQTMAPNQGLVQQQQGSMGGTLKNGLGNFLKNELTPQQNSAPTFTPGPDGQLHW